MVDAALRQFGVVRVDDVEELLDVGDAFAQPRRPTGPRVAVVTTSGGSGLLAADAVEAHGLQLAQLSPDTRSALAAMSRAGEPRVSWASSIYLTSAGWSKA